MWVSLRRMSHANLESSGDEEGNGVEGVEESRYNCHEPLLLPLLHPPLLLHFVLFLWYLELLASCRLKLVSFEISG